MNHDLLVQDLKRYSLRTGEEFTLASGQKSNVYVDVKKTALNGRCYPLLAELIGNILCLYFSNDPDPNAKNVETLAGVVLGGCHLASIVASSYKEPFDVVYVRPQPKDHGTQQVIECSDDCGKNVVLIEDVVTTGKSVIKAAKLLEQNGFNVVGIIAVVDRRVEQTKQLDSYPFRSLVKFEELIREDDAKESK
jgi:orotate phosphoribosyltransferase